tara:strand:- start:1225 stop:1716 length:492 start_codon:yes stop_codon:yes gene_type:complete
VSCQSEEVREPGLYRTTVAHPIAGDQIPAGRLVYVGNGQGGPFVVVPHYNEKNRWFWREPTVPLTDAAWAGSLTQLRPEGFYTLPETLDFDGGGRWLQNAIVQLGYDQSGQGILFVAERRDTYEDNALYFSDRGKRIEDTLLARLVWAPILPVSEPSEGPTRH